MKRLALLLLLVALGGAGVLLWPRSQHTASDVAAAGQSSQTPAVPVSVANVVAKPVPVEFGTIGTVTAYATVAVKSRLDGEIMEYTLAQGEVLKVDTGHVAMYEPTVGPCTASFGTTRKK